MKVWWLPLLLLALPGNALGDCLALGPMPAASSCSSKSAEIELIAPTTREKFEERRSTNLEPLLADPAFRTGLWVTGEVSFRLHTDAERLVEVFLMFPRDYFHPVALHVNGAPADTRYQTKPGPGRLRPRSGLEEISLLARVGAGATIAVRTDAPRYVVSAVRTTAVARFESELVPAFRRRLGQLVADPFLDGLRSSRRHPIEQLAVRLLLSSDPVTRREGAVGVARALYWEAAENHEPRDMERARRALEDALRVAPDDAIVHQMVSASCTGLNVGSRIMPAGWSLCGKARALPWDSALSADPPGAPAWATSQRRLVLRMEAITRWWVEKRQNPNGELGGGWGDDVEILRSWGPQALGLGSRTAAEGLRRIADGLWASGTLLHGYDRGISDVEHSSEPTTDTLPLRAAAFPEDGAALARLGETASCAFYWIALQPDGKWRFRSSWFNCRDYDPRPERALDVHLNTRAAGPALWHAFFSHDPQLISLLARWGESWVEAMRSTRHGKPAGIFPSVLRSADGEYLIGTDGWDRPLAEWDYFQWSGGSQEGLASLMLALHDLTGEKRWLDAAEESFSPLERCHLHANLCEQIRRSPEAFLAWRRLSGNPRFDRAFGFDPAQDRDAILGRMAEMAREAEQRLAHNFDMFTSEVLFTDRVYYQLPAEYRQRLFGGESPRGDRYPTFAVTWPAAEGEFARAVLDATPRSLEMALYGFEEREMGVPVLLWRLEPGEYRWESRDRTGRPLGRGTFVKSSSPQRVSLTLPSRTAAFISILGAGK